MDLLEYIGKRIRDFRTSFGSTEGISQEAMAKEIKTTANTISRRETGVYRPSLDDLDRLSRFFGVSILEFFPPEETKKNDQIAALLRAAKQLPDEDVEELRRYAEFRRARVLLKSKRQAVK